ncbi:hypothetical protein PRJ_3541 [Pseudomonas sp. XWY-1]|nr:hypothetical protein PRJ_3541 [Pseudomonas sp. XWY-1]
MGNRDLWFFCLKRKPSRVGLGLVLRMQYHKGLRPWRDGNRRVSWRDFAGWGEFELIQKTAAVLQFFCSTDRAKGDCVHLSCVAMGRTAAPASTSLARQVDAHP